MKSHWGGTNCIIKLELYNILIPVTKTMFVLSSCPLPTVWKQEIISAVLPSRLIACIGLRFEYVCIAAIQKSWFKLWTRWSYQNASSWLARQCLAHPLQNPVTCSFFFPFQTTQSRWLASEARYIPWVSHGSYWIKHGKRVSFHPQPNC